MPKAETKKVRGFAYAWRRLHSECCADLLGVTPPRARARTRGRHACPRGRGRAATVRARARRSQAAAKPKAEKKAKKEKVWSGLLRPRTPF